MIDKYVLYPESIYLVKEDRIQDGTVTSLDSLKNDATAYAVPRRAEEGVTLNFNESGVDVRERDKSGKLVHIDHFNTEFGMSFTINLGRFDFRIEALLRGQHPDTVKEDYVASLEAADDSTVTGLEFVRTIMRDKFTWLFEMPEEKSTGKRLYYYIPKATRESADREKVLNVQQISSPITFRALALDDDLSPDPVLAHQAVYSGVTHTDLAFAFYGKVDES